MNIGDTIKFGNYGGEPIEFEVKDIINGNALLVSKNIIECRRFDASTTNWNDCELRKWLNNDFYNTAFNDEEKSQIQTYSATNDKVFLLSKDECKKYFPSDTARQKKGTQHAKNNRLYVSSYTGYSWYWLRSAYSSHFVNLVSFLGDFFNLNPTLTDNGLAPALIVKI